MGRYYLAPTATVVGDVVLENGANVWYGAVLRGDSGRILLGENTNVQDNCVIHEQTTLGKNCTVGHGAIVHGCTVGDGTTIGMGAIVLTGARLGSRCMVGAGAVVTGKTDAPEGSLLLGSPARVVRPLRPEEIAAMEENAAHYLVLAERWLPKTE